MCDVMSSPLTLFVPSNLVFLVMMSVMFDFDIIISHSPGTDVAGIPRLMCDIYWLLIY